jgi:hypothetical protein
MPLDQDAPKAGPQLFQLGADRGLCCGRRLRRAGEAPQFSDAREHLDSLKIRHGHSSHINNQ